MKTLTYLQGQLERFETRYANSTGREAYVIGDRIRQTKYAIQLFADRDSAIKSGDWMGRILIENKLESLNIKY